MRSRQGRAGSRRLGKLLEAFGSLAPPGAHPLLGSVGPGAGALGREARVAWRWTELNVRGPVSSPSPDLTVSPQTCALPAREPRQGRDPTPWET